MVRRNRRATSPHAEATDFALHTNHQQGNRQTPTYRYTTTNGQCSQLFPQALSANSQVTLYCPGRHRGACSTHMRGRGYNSSPSSADMCTIETNTGTISATSTTPNAPNTVLYDIYAKRFRRHHSEQPPLLNQYYEGISTALRVSWASCYTGESCQKNGDFVL